MSHSKKMLKLRNLAHGGIQEFANDMLAKENLNWYNDGVLKKQSTEKILRKKTSNYFNSAKNYPIRIKVRDTKSPKLNIHNAKPVSNSKNEFAKAALCLFVYNKRYYFQKTKKQQLKPLGGSIALQDLNTLDTLYRSLKKKQMS
jgi:hypothetical protein